MKKTILITGGCGFIGHHFVEHIYVKTDWNIIVLDKGAIIEQGTHQNLLLKKGKYFEMWEKQKPS